MRVVIVVFVVVGGGSGGGAGGGDVSSRHISFSTVCSFCFAVGVFNHAIAPSIE